MNTRRTFAALALLGTTLTLTGAVAASPASALRATSPFCKAAGQLPTTLAYFGPTATPTQVAAVLKTDTAVNATAVRLLAADRTGSKATTMSRNIQYFAGFAVTVATRAKLYAAALAANPTTATAIKDLAGAAGFSKGIAGDYANLLITLHLTQGKLCPNIRPIETTPTTTTTATTTTTINVQTTIPASDTPPGVSTVIQTSTTDGNTVTTSDIPTIGNNTGGTNPLTPPTYPGK